MANSTQRLKALAATRRKEVSSTTAFNPQFKKKFGVSGGDVYSVRLKASKSISSVAILDEEGPVQTELDKKFSGNLMDGVPSMSLMVDGKRVYLTWEEAYNLGYSLCHVAEVALNG